MDWIKNLRPGDKVVVKGPRGKCICAVTAIQKLHIVIGETKYRISDGSKVGAYKYNPECIHECTDKDVEEFREYRRRNLAIKTIKEFDLAVVPTEQIEAAPKALKGE